MRLIRGFFWSIASLGILVMLAGWYGGFFESPVIKHQEIDSFHIAYRYYQGKPDGLRSVTNELIAELTDSGVEVYKTVFIINDQQHSENVKALLACIIAKNYRKKLPSLKTKFRIAEVNPGFCMTGHMAYENWLNILAADWRLRPVLEGMAEKLKMYPFSIIEIRDKAAGMITYILVEDHKLPPELLQNKL